MNEETVPVERNSLYETDSMTRSNVAMSSHDLATRFVLFTVEYAINHLNPL